MKELKKFMKENYEDLNIDNFQLIKDCKEEERNKIFQRQGLLVTIKELENLIKELKYNTPFCHDRMKHQINIINKKGLSDTWEIEK